MIIGLDIDGVLTFIDRPMLAVINNWTEEDIKGRDQIEQFYYNNLKPRLNPVEIANIDDKILLITGRNTKFRSITIDWLKRWNIRYDKLIMTSNAMPHGLMGKTLEDWNKHHATLKVKALKENNVEVYFEDNGLVVKLLRNLCPEIKIIQYGNEVAWRNM